MKIIFLDIDGVLNSRAYDRRRNWDEQTDIDETRLPLGDNIGIEILTVVTRTDCISIRPLPSSGYRFLTKRPTSV